MACLTGSQALIARRDRGRARIQHLVCAVGSGPVGAGAALVPGDLYRLLLGEPEAGGERPVELGGVGPGRQPLGHELTHGLEHPRPRPELRAVEVDQAVAGQRLG